MHFHFDERTVMLLNTICILFIFYHRILGTDIWNSMFDLSNQGWQYIPFDGQILSVGMSSKSLLTCTHQCLRLPLCRTFNFDSQTKTCRLYEGDMNTTGSIVSSSSTTIYGSLVLKSANYLNYGLPCSFCDRNRYLTCTNGTCQCHIHEYFDGYVCRSQKSSGYSCINNTECRQDRNLTCGSNRQCECTSLSSLITSFEFMFFFYSNDNSAHE